MQIKTHIFVIYPSSEMLLSNKSNKLLIHVLIKNNEFHYSYGILKIIELEKT